jgi:hypothetical protein
MSKNTLILRKLVKIAVNKQRILAKLAEKKAADPETIDYIQNRLIAVVAVNLGLSNVNSKVTYNPPPDPMVVTTPGEPGKVSTQESDKYFADIFGVPANKRESFAKAIGVQLQSQKPELLGRFSYWFKE